MTIKNKLPEPTVPECEGCDHVFWNQYYKIDTCSRYLHTKAQWRSRICPSATHMHKQQAPEQKKRAGQQHQQKGKQLSKKQQESYKRLG